MRVSVQLFHWEPTKMSFQLTKVSFIWLEPTKASLSSRFGVVSTDISISPVGLCQLSSVYSAELSNGKQCRREIDLSTQSCNCQFKPRGRSSETAKKHFYAQLLYCKQTKKAVWAECSAASVLNPNNVCVSRG